MPLAAAEFLGAKHRWLAELLTEGEPRNFRTTLERSDAFEVVTAGGYPAALRRATPTQRTRWFASYLADVMPYLDSASRVPAASPSMTTEKGRPRSVWA